MTQLRPIIPKSGAIFPQTSDDDISLFSARTAQTETQKCSVLFVIREMFCLHCSRFTNHSDKPSFILYISDRQHDSL